VATQPAPPADASAPRPATAPVVTAPAEPPAAAPIVPSQPVTSGPSNGVPRVIERTRRRRGRRKAPIFPPKEVLHIDYKDVEKLRRLITERGKIDPRRKTGLIAKDQRKLTRAIKRARHLALLPYTADHMRQTSRFRQTMRAQRVEARPIPEPEETEAKPTTDDEAAPSVAPYVSATAPAAETPATPPPAETAATAPAAEVTETAPAPASTLEAPAAETPAAETPATEAPATEAPATEAPAAAPTAAAPADAPAEAPAAETATAEPESTESSD